MKNFLMAETSFIVPSDCQFVRTSDSMEWRDAACGLCASPTGQIEPSFFRPIPSLMIVSAHRDQETNVLIDNLEFNAAMPAGSVSILPPETGAHSLTYSAYKTSFVYIRPAVITEVADQIFGKSIETIEIQTVTGMPETILSNLMGAFTELLTEEHAASFRSDYLARAIAAEVLAKYAQLTGVRSLKDAHVPLSVSQMKQIREFMEGNIDGDFNFSELAAVVGISRTVFFQRFRANIGCTPNQFLQRLRVERAKFLLKDRRFSLAQIALACGYADQSHMARFFLKIVGISPGKYRRNYLG